MRSYLQRTLDFHTYYTRYDPAALNDAALLQLSRVTCYYRKRLARYISRHIDPMYETNRSVFRMFREGFCDLCSVESRCYGECDRRGIGNEVRD